MVNFRVFLAFFCLVIAGDGMSQIVETAGTPCVEPQCKVAERDSAVVTVADVMAKIALLEPAQQNTLLSDPKQINKMIENLLIVRQIANEADPEKVKSDVVLQARLKQVEEEVVAVYQLDRIRDERVTSNFDLLAQEHYLANKASMKTDAEAKVRHILIDATKRSRAEAKAEAEKLAAELKGADADRFSSATMDRSEDPSKANNGGIIQVSEASTDIAPPFLAAALALKTVGEISPPIETEFGFHLIQLLSMKPSEPVPFEMVKASIIDKLKQDARRRVVGEYRAELMSRAEAKVYPKNLERVIIGEDAPAAK